MPFGKFNGVNFKPIFFNESFSPRRRHVMLLRAGGPTQTGHGPISDKGDVLEMIALRGVGSLYLYEPEADDLAITEVMVLSCPVRKKGAVMYWNKN